MDEEASNTANSIQTEDVEKFNQEYAQKLSLNDEPQAGQQSHPAVPPHLLNPDLYTILDDVFAAQIYEFNKMSFTLNQWDSLINALNSHDIVQKYYGLIGIRKLLSIQHNPPIQKVIDSGLIPHLVQYAHQTEFLHLQFEALWSLTNVASGNSNQTKAVVDNGGIQLFIGCLTSTSLAIAQQAIWAIGNLAGDNHIFRDALINNSAIQKLIGIISQNQNNHSLVRNGTWALCNLCRGHPRPQYNLIRDAIQFCCRFIIQKFVDDKEILTDLLWSLAYPEELKDDLNPETADKLVANVSLFLSSHIIAIVVPSLRILANLFEKQALTDFFIKNNYINMLLPLLNNNKKSVRRETCFLIGRLTDVHNYTFEEVFPNPNIVQKLLEMFGQDDGAIKIQVGHVFANLSCHDNLQKVYEFYVQTDILKYYAEMLKGDTKMITESLGCIKKILEVGQKFLENDTNPLVLRLEELGGTETLEKLQCHSSLQVYNLALQILEDYYITDEVVQEQPQGNNSLQANAAAPAPSLFGTQFGFSSGFHF